MTDTNIKSKSEEELYQDMIDVEIQQELEKDLFDHDCKSGPEDSCVCDVEK